jgi:hypothetical protein
MLNDLKERGSVALAEWNARADASPWGRPNTRKLLGADTIRAIEERYLPASMQRDYAATWGHRTDFTEVSSSRPEEKSAPGQGASRRRSPSSHAPHPNPSPRGGRRGRR